jgi:antitoxin VapB
MAFDIDDPETERIVRKLAKLKGKSLEDAIREAVENEYEIVRQAMSAEQPSAQKR